MFKAFSRAGAQTVKFHFAIELLELHFDKSYKLTGPVVIVWEKSPRVSKSQPGMFSPFIPLTSLSSTTHAMLSFISFRTSHKQIILIDIYL